MSKPTFKVSLVFEGVASENPLEAAKQIVEWLKDAEDGAENMTFDVVNETTKEAFTVDLAEEDEDAVLPNDIIKVSEEMVEKAVESPVILLTGILNNELSIDAMRSKVIEENK